MTRSRLQPALFFGTLGFAWLSFALLGYLWHKLVLEPRGGFPVLGNVLSTLPFAESPPFGWPFALAGFLYGWRAGSTLRAALGWALALGVSGALLRGCLSRVVSGWEGQSFAFYLGYYLSFVLPSGYLLVGLLLGRVFASLGAVSRAGPPVRA